ncbi:MAG: hypothetical protein K2X39_05055 [Silvanigrellaceae bacterium]|nr:hypothetical protein [Silvanigrellaceae bacterium]
MSFSVTQAAVCFIACHGGPADHFATFTQNLSENKSVEIFATGAALKKFQEKGVEVKNPFSIENISSEEEDVLAEQIAKACLTGSIIITDVGHSFDVKLQNALARQVKPVPHFAYYDNPEPFVPGGYSKVASQVMLAADGVLFANANFAESPILQDPDNIINFREIKRIGIGYYPIGQAEKIAKRREEEHATIRQQLFSKHHLVESNQKILVYFGGNNDEYFDKAFPAFLTLLEKGMEHSDFSNLVFVIQQHPGAKGKNLDVNKMLDWVNTHGERKNAPKIIVSDFSSDDAQVLADGAFYYQTSMGPQFVLAGIPTVQVGHETYPDILVKNNLSPSVKNVDQFVDALENLDMQKKDMQQDIIFESLGIRKNWLQILKEALGIESQEIKSEPAKQNASVNWPHYLATGTLVLTSLLAVREVIYRSIQQRKINPLFYLATGSIILISILARQFFRRA